MQKLKLSTGNISHTTVNKRFTTYSPYKMSTASTLNDVIITPKGNTFLTSLDLSFILSFSLLSCLQIN